VLGTLSSLKELTLQGHSSLHSNNELSTDLAGRLHPLHSSCVL